MFFNHQVSEVRASLKLMLSPDGVQSFWLARVREVL